MSFRKNHADRSITFTCDMCGETYEADTPDFHDALDEYKDRGGVARLEVGEWMHFCEDCK